MTKTQKLRIGPEQPTFQNPLGLQIGEQVKVKAFVDLIYDKSTKTKSWIKKILYYSKFKQPRLMIVCGVRKKATGKLSKGYSGGYFEDYEPSTFTADKYHWLYEVKLGISDKIKLVHPKHIIKLDS